MAGVFGQMNATLSSFFMPALRRPEASRLTRSSNCRYVYFRLPWTTAVLSGKTYALRSRKLIGVSSVRYTSRCFIAEPPAWIRTLGFGHNGARYSLVERRGLSTDRAAAPTGAALREMPSWGKIGEP